MDLLQFTSVVSILLFALITMAAIADDLYCVWTKQSPPWIVVVYSVSVGLYLYNKVRKILGDPPVILDETHIAKPEG